MTAAVIKWDKKIYSTAVVFGVYIKKLKKYVHPHQIAFTDLGTFTYWDGGAWIRWSETAELYILLPKNTLDLFPSAEVMGEIEVMRWVEGGRELYLADLNEVGDVVWDGYKG